MRLADDELARATRDLALLHWLDVRCSDALPLPADYNDEADDQQAAVLPCF